MTEPEYLSPRQWTPCSLSLETPPGLFRPTFGPLVLIAEIDPSKIAIMLEEYQGRERFFGFQLTADSSAWTGIHLGPVELELDWTSFTPEEASVGAIEIRQGGARLTTYGNRWERLSPSLCTVEGATSPRSTGSFTRWQLVHRTESGETVTMFQHG